MRPTRVREIMQHRIVPIGVGERLSTVEDIMTLAGVRHMPVVHGGELVGVVSERDLLRASLSILADHRRDERRAFLHGVDITRVMSSPPVTIGPDEAVEQAALSMVDHKIGCLPVLDDGRLLGMLTETDVLRYFAAGVSARRSAPTPAAR
jgi:acetoin utilization protein AcuB